MEASSRIFVKGLPAGLTVDEFRRHFSEQSPITDSKFIPHRRIGYVGFRTPEAAARAVRYHNKSFVRMSKIGVELARSIDEEQKKLGSYHRGPKKSQVPITHDNKGYREERNNANDVTIQACKKRRISAKNDKENDKLQDFLQAMQPPGKSKAWDNQEIFAGSQKHTPDAKSRALSKPTADENSDTQHDLNPRNEETPKDGPSIRVECATEEHKVPTTSDANAVERLETQPVSESALHSYPETRPATSDDDWLRSRTSRLLGLIEEGEDFTRKPQLQDEAKLKGPKDEDGDPIQKSILNTQRDNLVDAGTSTGSKQRLDEANDHDVSMSRLFLRNLAYTATEADIRSHFECNGFQGIEEVHLPLHLQAGGSSNKGFAHVQFTDSQIASRALRELDQKPFQGRLLHILPASPKPAGSLDEFTISKLPHKWQQRIRRKAEAASFTFNWNSLYMNSDAVIASVSDRLGVSKSELLDPTSSDAAVKQAHAETHVIQETKSYFAANGVDLDAFKENVRGKTAILVKNFPYGTKADELRALFNTYGPLARLLMPPSGTIAIVEFEREDHARSAFGNLSYSKFKDSILYLEKAPKDLFSRSKVSDQLDGRNGSEVRQVKTSTIDLLGEEQPDVINTATLFVRNLNFITTSERLREVFVSLDGFLSARVKRKPDPKKEGTTLSMGFGFLEFRSKQQAQAALAAMDGYKLDGHELLIRASHKSVDAAEERRKDDKAKKIAERKTKIIIKNLPFQATKKDIRSLFGAYGQVRSLRVPKKFDSSTRGFAFADFVTAREAGYAMDALKNTHLLGRRLILQFAADEETEPEAVIEQMQKKVGKQADKVALQKLTGTGRKKFNVVDKADGLDQLVD